MAMKVPARILKLQTLHPDIDSIHQDAALLSTFSVMCPETIQGGQGVFEMK